jgi:4-amino-4-deoxy-L-arabinose transferase-like glycosyltransferase
MHARNELARRSVVSGVEHVRFGARSLQSIDRVTALTLAALAGLTLLRIAGLLLSQMELDVEEAQYWTWSTAPAFGYFSKPPLIAWIMGAAERVCGSGEACLRAPAPLLWFATAAVLFALTRRLYGATTAVWAALLFALAPGIAFSARLITTDVPLLLCWAVALYALVRLRETQAWSWALLLGAALGVGLLAKYAMIYFVVCALLYAAVDPVARRALLSWRGLAACAVAALIVAPNLAWNALNQFQTFAHVQDNVAGRGFGTGLRDLLAFVGGQVGIIGPILFVVLVARLLGYGRTDRPAADRLLLVFSAAILVPLVLYAIATPAKANWTAVAYVAGIPLATASLVHARRDGWLKIALALGLLTQVALLVGDALASRIRLPFYPGREPYARVLGWADLARGAEARARQAGASGVVTMTRSDAALFSYYLRKSGLPVMIWPGGPQPDNYFEWTRPLRPELGPLVVVSPWPMRDLLQQAFAEVADLGLITAATGRTTSRAMLAYRVAAPRQPVRPWIEYLRR